MTLFKPDLFLNSRGGKINAIKFPQVQGKTKKSDKGLLLFLFYFKKLIKGPQKITKE